MREAIELLLNSDTSLVKESTHSYLRNTLNHCAQMVDVVEMYRESAGALISTYMSSVAHRSNEIMKVLTMMSSIFVPLTFIAGIYGMNFENMPELSHPLAYPVTLASMAGTAAVMILYFLRRGWFGRANLQVGAGTREMSSHKLAARDEGNWTHTFKANEPANDAGHNSASPANSAAA